LLQQTLRKKWEQTKVKSFRIGNLSKDFSLSATGGEGASGSFTAFLQSSAEQQRLASKTKHSDLPPDSFKAYIVQQQMTIF